jgi:hypothetical protein
MQRLTLISLLALAACSSSTSGAPPSTDASTDAREAGGGSDGSSSDSSAPLDAGSDSLSTADTGGGGTEGGPGTFACGPSLSCTATQFCFEEGGGVPVDGGNNMTYVCMAIPTACLVNPSCVCIEASDAGTNGCPCSVQGGGFLVACLFP